MNALSAKQLVGELERLGVGVWTPDAVRQWIRETPPCPIAVAADQGKPHRYALDAVLQWLLDRAGREKGRGYTSASAMQLVERIEFAKQSLVSGPGFETGAQSGAAAQAAPMPLPLFTQLPAAVPAPFSPAKEPELSAHDIEQSTDVEMLLRVIQGRGNPQVWKATEEALTQRRKRLEADGKLIPVDDLDRSLVAQALRVRMALQDLVGPLAQRIPDQSTVEHRRALLQGAIDSVLATLAAPDDESDPPQEHAA